MALSRLKVTGLRNLGSVSLEPGAGFNIFCGDNGSGKTSLLEAIYLLGTGKSFRVSQHRTLINVHSDRFTVYCELEPKGYAIGIERSHQGDPHIVINGDRVHSASQLASVLPVQAITLDDFQLFEGGPRIRRRFLDWGVFHVEQAVQGPLFRQFERTIKQRNSGLKSGKMTGSELRAWTQEFLHLSARLHDARLAYAQELMTEFQAICEGSETLQFGQELNIQYSPGWDQKMTLAEALEKPGNRERERRTGITQIGPHRADLRMTWEGLPARDVLSRGQMKVLGHSLKLAQIRCLSRHSDAALPVILVDDLAAELDQAYLAEMLRLIDSFETQVFMTVLAAEQLPASELWCRTTEQRWFSVSEGRVQPNRLQE